ncbi:MAG TPA: hypothetical protein P5114_07890 [Hyphomicrobiaceae bacterium]|nr:hypothetical protein [Hyphomicrobiaceae bacterium]
MMRIVGRISAMALVLMAILFSGSSNAAADSPFASLAGTWSGRGKIRLQGGKSETIRCRAYYTTNNGGSGLNMAIRCASASNKMEMRANLNYSNGAISGNWEERTYNATGAVTGQATSSRMMLSIAGGGINGSMSVRLGGASQSVSISTEGSTFRGLDLSLSRG